MRLKLLSPLAVLAVLVVASACSKPRSEETTHLIPPAAPYVAPVVDAAAPVPAPERTPAPGLGVRAIEDDDRPSAEEVREFHRKVAK